MEGLLALKDNYILTYYYVKAPNEVIYDQYCFTGKERRNKDLKIKIWGLDSNLLLNIAKLLNFMQSSTDSFYSEEDYYICSNQGCKKKK